MQGFLFDNCFFSIFDEETVRSCSAFGCGDNDLDEFFIKDSLNYAKELLGKTYCFRLNDNPSKIVCIFTVSNDSLRVDLLPSSRKNKINKNIPHVKHSRSYPAVLLGRLGVNTEFANQGIGRELIRFIMSWFVNKNNKTGCRYMIVDAYNQEKVIKFYLKCGFDFVFSTEEQEKVYASYPKEEPLSTRLMVFDLIHIVEA